MSELKLTIEANANWTTKEDILFITQILYEFWEKMEPLWQVGLDFTKAACHYSTDGERGVDFLIALVPQVGSDTEKIQLTIRFNRRHIRIPEDRSQPGKWDWEWSNSVRVGRIFRVLIVDNDTPVTTEKVAEAMVEAVKGVLTQFASESHARGDNWSLLAEKFPPRIGLLAFHQPEQRTPRVQGS